MAYFRLAEHLPSRPIQTGYLIMRCRIAKSFTFDAAHWLPHVPEGHKCHRMHGHTYTVVLGLEDELDPIMGWVQDFGEVSRAFAPLLERFDHYCLNEIEGLENPTAEIMAVWIFDRLKADLPQLTDVAVRETPTAEAVYRP